MNDLVKWSDIEKRIDAVKDIKTITEMQGQMDALRALAKQQGESLKVVNKCATYKFLLEQKAGEIYAGLEAEQTRGLKRGPLSSDFTTGTTKQTAEAETGKTRSTLNAWAKEAEIPRDFVEAYVAKCNDTDNGQEVTSKGIVRKWRSEQPKDNIEYPTDIYSIIYADPPWKYTEGGLTGVSDADTYGNVRKKYKQLSIAELCEIPVAKWVAENAVLFMWVTAAFALACAPVISAWGFEYKTQFVWYKVKHNFGYYNSVRHELLYVCTRGSFRPQNKELIDSVQVIERTGHSTKPDRFREIIDSLYPQGERLEMFARGPLPDGWIGWGNEYEC